MTDQPSTTPEVQPDEGESTHGEVGEFIEFKDRDGNSRGLYLWAQLERWCYGFTATYEYQASLHEGDENGPKVEAEKIELWIRRHGADKADYRKTCKCTDTCKKKDRVNGIGGSSCAPTTLVATVTDYCGDVWSASKRIG